MVTALVSGLRTRSCTAMKWNHHHPRGPRSCPSYSCLGPSSLNLAPSAPLAGTSRFHRTAAYTRCLRCAGAPRRPASGSGLSLTIPSWHAILYDPGEFDTSISSRAAMSTWPSPRVDRLGTPKTPAIRFTRAMTFVASWFTHLLRPASLLASLNGSDQISRSHRRLLRPGFRRVGHPSRRWI